VEIKYVSPGQALGGKKMAGLVHAIIQLAKSQRLAKRILNNIIACVTAGLAFEKQKLPAAELLCPVSE
jgi:uncharacterized membrane protein AbrB (regulator of aidB expression)